MKGNYEDKLHEVALKGVEKVRQFLDDEIPNSGKVKIGMLALTQYNRFIGTVRVKDSLSVAIARHLSKDRKEFKKYLEISVPHLVPKAQIEGQSR